MSDPRFTLVNAPWSVQTPCDERWENMVGDARVRRCARCDKDVHDLSAHAVEEAAALRASPARPCIRITQRADGAIRVREGWWVSGRAAVLATALAACGPFGASGEPAPDAANAQSAPNIAELEAPPELSNIAETLTVEPVAPTRDVVTVLTGDPIEEPPAPPVRQLRGRPAPRQVRVEPSPNTTIPFQVLGGVPPQREEQP